MRCRECVHYVPELDDDGDPMTPECGECDCDKWEQGYDRKPPPVDGVKVENDEGWAFLVGPEFWCLHWKPK